MSVSNISGGVVHQMPPDLKRALLANKNAIAKWEGLTPLARNEWICWNITVKLSHTRAKHIERTIIELIEGKRRPCCWMGCIHRTDKAISPSVKGILSRRSKAG